MVGIGSLSVGITDPILPSSSMEEPNAGNWKTWVISSGNALRLPEPGLDMGRSVGKLAIARAIHDGAG